MAYCFKGRFLIIPPFVSLMLLITTKGMDSIFSISVFSLFSSSRVTTVYNVDFPLLLLFTIPFFRCIRLPLFPYCRDHLSDFINTLWEDTMSAPVYSYALLADEVEGFRCCEIGNHGIQSNLHRQKSRQQKKKIMMIDDDDDITNSGPEFRWGKLPVFSVPVDHGNAANGQSDTGSQKTANTATSRLSRVMSGKCTLARQSARPVMVRRFPMRQNFYQADGCVRITKEY